MADDPREYTVSQFMIKARNNNAEFHWLLDLFHVGTPIRIADANLAIATDPTSILYRNGIYHIIYNEGLIINGTVLTRINLDLWTRNAMTIKANVEITGHLQLHLLDQTFGLAAWKGELSLWQKGLYFEERYIVL